MVEYIDLPTFSTGKKMRIKIKEVLCDKKTKYQNMLIVDTNDFGKCLILDEIMQCSERDHLIYDKEILKMLKETDKSILILGGGDGYVAERALKVNPNLKIKIFELDNEVVDGSKMYLGQAVFNNKNVELHVGDALEILRNFGIKSNEKFDGIICDLTGEPITPEEQKKFENFYKELLELSKMVLKNGGWIAAQAGDSDLSGKYIDGAKFLKKIFKRVFVDVYGSSILIPSYGEYDSFLFGRKAL